MAEYNWLMTPLEFIKTAGTSSDVQIILLSGAPDGNTSPCSDAAKGSWYIRDDATDDESFLYLKVDDDSADDDWVAVWVDKDEAAKTLEAALTMDADNKIQLRDTAIFIHSNADGELTIAADTQINIGDGTNQVEIQADGEIQLAGTAKVTQIIPLDLDTQHGTATSGEFKGAPSIDLDADTEEWFISFPVPGSWDAASDMTLVFMVANEIAEDDGDDVSFTGQARGYADGETVADAGQAVTCTLNLTGGDEAIDICNRVTGTIDWDHGVYPIAAGDTVVAKMIVNITGGGECTGPLRILSQWVEYVANKLGAAT